MFVSNILNQYSFIIPIFIAKVISFYTFIITLCISFYNFVKNMHAFALTVSLLTFLTVYTVNKAKEAIIKLHYYSDILTKLLEQNKVCQRLLKHPNTQKTLFVYNYIKNYINTFINYLKMRNICGLENLNDRLVYTFVHKDKITRIPIQFNSFNIQNITMIQYMLHGKNYYESLKDHVEYINSFINNKYRNINITPGLICYQQIKLNTMNEEFEIVEKEYFVNDIIN